VVVSEGSFFYFNPAQLTFVVSFLVFDLPFTRFLFLCCLTDPCLVFGLVFSLINGNFQSNSARTFSRASTIYTKMRSSLSIACGLAFAAIASAIPTISVKGSKFFTSDGNQYFVRGIAYQLVPQDPLIDNNQCQLDASLMKTLGANAIRVYHVDPEADHQSCMKTFADAGIYLFVDLDTFTTQIEQTSPQWNQSQFDAFAKVMDEFQQFDNTAGFFVGNEVLTTGDGSIAAPYVKAAARDMKAYRNSKNYRNIPVGYSAADISSLRPNLQNYLACGTNSSDALDFFSLNAYVSRLAFSY
jgi:hypothetical protein